jgi:hypothetical protein
MDTRKIGQVIGTVMAVVWFVIACVVLGRALAGRYDKQGQTTGEAIYIIGVKLFQEYDGADAFMLTYAVSGAIQAVAFKEPDKMEDYMDYLRSIGDVSAAPSSATKSGADL